VTPAAACIQANTLVSSDPCSDCIQANTLVSSDPCSDWEICIQRRPGLSLVLGLLFLERVPDVKRSGCNADHSPPSSVNIKHEWS
jgi:hypothetical protein